VRGNQLNLDVKTQRKISFAIFIQVMKATIDQFQIKNSISKRNILHGMKIQQTQIGDSFLAYSTCLHDQNIIQLKIIL
jgi:hypothetical protein